jgi:hypothetical protein
LNHGFFTNEFPNNQLKAAYFFVQIDTGLSLLLICLLPKAEQKINWVTGQALQVPEKSFVIRTGHWILFQLCIQGCQMVSFSDQKSQILEGLRLENVNIFNGHLEYFIDIWDIL